MLRVRLCYRMRKGHPNLKISSGVIPRAQSVHIPTAKFNILGFLEDDGYVGGGGSKGRRVYAKLTKTSEKRGHLGLKKRPRQSSLHDGYGLTEILTFRGRGEGRG